MKKSQSGFTLVELVVVIVLLGILGVTALGKFQDLSGNAEAAAVTGVASELSASASINYANALVGNTNGQAITNTTAGTEAVACGTALLANLFASNSFPTGYSTAFGATTATTNDACDASGDTYSCTITSDSDGTATATATILCTGG